MSDRASGRQNFDNCPHILEWNHPRMADCILNRLLWTLDHFRSNIHLRTVPQNTGRQIHCCLGIFVRTGPVSLHCSQRTHRAQMMCMCLRRLPQSHKTAVVAVAGHNQCNIQRKRAIPTFESAPVCRPVPPSVQGTCHYCFLCTRLSVARLGSTAAPSWRREYWHACCRR